MIIIEVVIVPGLIYGKLNLKSPALSLWQTYKERRIQNPVKHLRWSV